MPLGYRAEAVCGGAGLKSDIDPSPNSPPRDEWQGVISSGMPEISSPVFYTYKSSLSASIRRDSAIRTASTSAKPVTPSPAAQGNRAASLLWERSGALAGLKA